MRHVRTLVVTLCLVAVWILTVSVSARQPQWMPKPVTNLQVLPKDISIKELVQTMRGFAMGLGVRCQHCHVFTGEDPNDLNTFDFASDEKAPKKTARTMMKMAMAINNGYLKDVGEARPAGELKVTCYTCHRRELKPETKRPDVP